MLHILGTYLHLPRIWYTVPEGIMQNSKAEKLRKLASKRQIVRAKDARELGIPRTYLPRLARRGDLEKVGRGLYSSRDFSGTENTSLIEAAYQIPKGIVCLLSALRFHNFTTQSPHEAWMAIGHKAWAPKVSSPPVRIVRMSGPALHFGTKEYSISGATLRVFSPAKTVADCFKFRGKVGLDVAIEALKECRRQKKASMDELAAAAKVCRVANVMRPYLESL
jgi:predicted transcriptional regulator of viral defense system